MRPENLARVRSSAHSYDSETHLTQHGLAAPPLVCGSIALPTGEAYALSKEQARATIYGLLKSKGAVLVGLNLAYDLIVAAQDAAERGIDLLPLIFAMFEDERVFDVGVAEQLHAIANGHLLEDPRTGAPLRDPDTGGMSGYRLNVVTDLVLGRVNAKANARWRKSYALLEHLPLSEWPPDARAYLLDDVHNPAEIAAAQLERNRNLHDLGNQVYTDFCLTLADAQGFRVDPQSVRDLEIKVLTERAKTIDEFIAADFFKIDKKTGLPGLTDTGAEQKNTALIKNLVADAYGVTGTCAHCRGSGKVPGQSACPACKDGDPAGCQTCFGVGKIDNIKIPRCKTCRGRKAHVASCADCAGTGKAPPEYASWKGCPKCDTTGRVLDSAPVPRTDGGGIGTGRDALTESGDELLINFAEFCESDKIRTSYIPWMMSGIGWGDFEIPLTLWHNILLNTGRISYNGLVQTLPRKGGVRECFKARNGHVLISADWTGVELVTHAQSCLWILGYSKLADTLNSGTAVHDLLGSEMSGIPYEEFLRRRKAGEKQVVDYRQSAKPANFGFPGGMGAPKLVLQQRKADFDTVAPDGTTYKGMRFCILMGGAERCGIEKVTKWGKADLSPTCKHCIECAEQLRETWFRTFPENRDYFKWVSKQVDHGEIVQHHSNRIRGGINFCSAANTMFQGLASEIAKMALRRVTREQYTDRSSALWGSRTLILMHDELILSAPREAASEAAKRLQVIMESCLREVCPDLASAAHAEPAIMERLYKGAEPVWLDGIEGGTLIPWEPSA